MRIPTYSQQVRQQGLPGVQQTNPASSAADFTNPQGLMLADASKQLGGNLEQGALNLIVQQDREAAQQKERERVEMDNFRVKDTLTKFDMSIQNARRNWMSQTGEAVLKQPDNRPLVENVVDNLTKERDAIEESLGTVEQRTLFRQHADDILGQERGRLINHEVQQIGVYKRGVLSSAIGNASNKLIDSDVDGIGAILDEIDVNGEALGRLEGSGADAGKQHASRIAQDGLKAAIANAIETGDNAKAALILSKYQKRFDPMDRVSVQGMIADSQAAQLLAENPNELLTRIHGGSEIIKNPKADGKLAQYTDTIAMEAANHGVDPEFMKAQIMAESSGNPNAESRVAHTGQRSIGLSQFQPSTAKRFGIDPTVPEQAIKGQAMYMQVLLNQFGGDYAKAAAAYNWGEGNVQKTINKYHSEWRDHLPDETKKYVDKLTAPKGADSILSTMSNESKLQWSNRAESEVRKNQSAYAAQLQVDIQNQYAQAADKGIAGDMIPMDSFLRAYGEKAPEMYADYTDRIGFGKIYASVSKMPVTEAKDTIEKMKPVTGSENYDRELDQYQKTKKAFEAADETRRNDPVKWAAAVGFQVEPVNFDNPEQAATALSNRVAIAQELETKYQLPPAPLMKSELSDLSDFLATGSENDQIKILTGLRDGLGYMYHDTIQQLRPDSPATKIAGHLIGLTNTQENTFSADVNFDGTEVARLILRGESMLNPSAEQKKQNGVGTGLKMPTELNINFYKEVGTAFGADPTTETQVLSAVRAYYAAKADKVDSSTYQDELLKEAVNAITGGIIEHAEQKVVVPYGMEEKDFTAESYKQFEAQYGANSLSVFNNLPMELAGPNMYAFKSGNGYLIGKKGFVIVDFNK